MFLLLLFVSIKPSLTLDNGVAITPPMGWIWEPFMCNNECGAKPRECISDRSIRNMAKFMKAEGYVEAGYNYIEVASCWMAPERDHKGSLVPDPLRFPRGIKPVADFLHSQGMKLGLHTSLGHATCVGRFPGSAVHIEKDATTFASWGVDMLKLDGCFIHPDVKSKMSISEKIDESFLAMGFNLNMTGRKMNLFCTWPFYQLQTSHEPPWAIIKSACNMWSSQDVGQGGLISWASLMKILHHYFVYQKTLQPLGGKGNWNYAAPVWIGHPALSLDMARVQMALWAVWASPLFVSTDLTNIPDWAAGVLKNKNVINIHQDALGHQGMRLPGQYSNGIQVWVKKLVNDRLAVIFLNTEHANTIDPFFDLRIFKPFLKDAKDDTRILMRDVFDGLLSEHKLTDEFHIEFMRPTSCVMLTVKAKGVVYDTINFEQLLPIDTAHPVFWGVICVCVAVLPFVFMHLTLVKIMKAVGLKRQ